MKQLRIILHSAHPVIVSCLGGADSIQIRVALLPTKKQKWKTKIKSIEEPEFNEEFFFKQVSAVDVRRLEELSHPVIWGTIKPRGLLGVAFGCSGLNPE